MAASKTIFTVILSALFLFGSPADAQFSRIIDSFAAQACNTVVGLISRPRSRLQCACDGSFTVEDGLQISMECESVQPRCIGPLCGQSTLQGKLTPRGIRDTEFCIYFGNIKALPPVCLKAAGGGGGFGRLSSCGLTVGDTECECVVCEGGRSFALDCSKAILRTPQFLPDLPGPSFGRCVTANTMTEFVGVFDGEDDDEAAPADEAEDEYYPGY